jgi:hypothetical protein
MQILAGNPSKAANPSNEIPFTFGDDLVGVAETRG